MVMRKAMAIVILTFLTVWSCNSNKGKDQTFSKSEEQKTTSKFYGNWISKAYLDSLDRFGMPSKVKHVGPLEISVNSTGDSLCLFNFNGSTTIYPVKQVTDTSFRIEKFNEDMLTDFYLNTGSTGIFYTSKNSNQKVPFFKAESKYAVKVIDGWKSAFELFLNERMIADNYFLLNSENKASSRVVFTSYGSIEGLPGYKKFNICFAGDCRKHSTYDLIELSDGTYSENFIWQWRNDTLVFYSVNNIAVASEVLHYEIGTDIFRFIKMR